MPATVLDSPWSAAGYGDVMLLDRLNQIWTDDELDALSEVYAPDVVLVTSWDPTQLDLDGIRTTITLTPNTYERAGPVSVTTGGVPGLPSLAAGQRYLTSVVIIHADEFDGVVGVNADNRIFFQYADTRAPAAYRLENGFSVPTPAPSGN